MIRRTIKKAVVGTAAAVAALVALQPATVAHADWPPVGPFYVERTGGIGVAYRTGPHQWPVEGYGAPEGAAVGLVCWSYGDRVGPNGNSLWWLVDYDKPDFWIADHWLSTPVPNGRPTLTGNCPGADEDPN